MKNSLSKKNIYLKNVSEYLVLWLSEDVFIMEFEVLFRGFFAYKYVYTWRTVHAVFTWQGG